MSHNKSTNAYSDNFLNKYNELIDKLDLSSYKERELDDKILMIKTFISNLKKNKVILKQFINRKKECIYELKLFEDDLFNKLLGEKLLLDDELWNDLHFTVLLYEIANNGNEKLQKKLYKSIKKFNNDFYLPVIL